MKTKTSVQFSRIRRHQTNLADDVREGVPLLPVLHHLLGVDRALLQRLVVVGAQVQVLEALGGVGVVVPGHLLPSTEARKEKKRKEVSTQ